MKVVITAAGPSLDAQVEPRFGRAPYFVLVDTETMELIEAIENPFIGQMSGVGVQAAQFIADKGVEAVITGNVGPKAFEGLRLAGIPVYTVVGGKVRQAAEKFKQGALQQVGAATSPAHSGGGWGRGMGRGMGMGLGMGMGRGMGGGCGMGMGRGMGAGPMPSAEGSDTSELNALKQQINTMQQMLEQIMKRLDNLEKKGG